MEHITYVSHGKKFENGGLGHATPYPTLLPSFYLSISSLSQHDDTESTVNQTKTKTLKYVSCTELVRMVKFRRCRHPEALAQLR